MQMHQQMLFCTATRQMCGIIAAEREVEERLSEQWSGRGLEKRLDRKRGSKGEREAREREGDEKQADARLYGQQPLDFAADLHKKRRKGREALVTHRVTPQVTVGPTSRVADGEREREAGGISSCSLTVTEALRSWLLMLIERREPQPRQQKRVVQDHCGAGVAGIDEGTDIRTDSERGRRRSLA